MKRQPYALSARTAVVVLCVAMPGTALSIPPGSIPYGAFDPGGDYTDETQNVIEHLFLPWEDVSLVSLVEADQYALERNRALLVTIEPWTWTIDERNTPGFLRRGILSGYYDGNMRAICAIFGDMQSPVTVRWGHEMERDEGQFIWAGWQPADYIDAFHRMIDICRGEAPKINVMWSPAGDEGMEVYYPGDEYVDLVGVSVFGLEAWEKDILGAPRSYDEVLAPIYARAAAFGKPVVVAELGYSGTSEYVAAWEDRVRQPQPDKPQLSGVVYFDQQEVYPWPDGFGLPDWRLDFRTTN